MYEDSTFPKGFDLSPCTDTINKIKLLDHKLDLFYRRTTKQQPEELFRRKTKEALTLPEYGDVVKCLDNIKLGIEDNLLGLETVFEGSVGPVVDVRSEKNSDALQKKVSVLEL